MLTLHQPPGAFGTPSVSPFCVKLETWLRMADVPFQVRRADPRRAPRGKMPYVRLEDGRLLGDSQLILEHLRAQGAGAALDEGLSPEQHARGHLVRRTLEESTYWVSVYLRWQMDDGWEEMRGYFTRQLPGWLSPLLLPVMRRRARAQLLAQGTGRHDRATVEAMGAADVAAVATVLGEGPYLLGDRPSSYDATAWAFLDGFARFPVPSLPGKEVAARPNLVDYLERIRGRYYEEKGAG